MKKLTKLIAVAIVAGTAALGAGTANAWWGDDDYYDYYDGPWGGGPWGHPGYGYGGYPGYGYGGYPGYGYGGYPGYGGGYPGYGYGGYPGYGGGYPGYGYAATSAPAAAPAQ